jgi:hypothetical protein
MKRYVLFALVAALSLGELSAGAAEIAEVGGAVVPAEAAPLFAAGGVLGQPVEVQGTVIIPVVASVHGGSVPLGVLVVKDGQVSVLMEESGKRFAEALSRSGKGGRGEAPRMQCGGERSAKGASGEAASGKKCSMKSAKGEDAPVKACPMKSPDAEGKKCAMMSSGTACPMKGAAAKTPDAAEAAPAESKGSAHVHGAATASPAAPKEDICH